MAARCCGGPATPRDRGIDRAREFEIGDFSGRGSAAMLARAARRAGMSASALAITIATTGAVSTSSTGPATPGTMPSALVRSWTTSRSHDEADGSPTSTTNTVAHIACQWMIA